MKRLQDGIGSKQHFWITHKVYLRGRWIYCKLPTTSEMQNLKDAKRRAGPAGPGSGVPECRTCCDQSSKDPEFQAKS